MTLKTCSDECPQCRYYDSESGFVFIYNWDDQFGWSLQINNGEGSMREYITLSREFWPETPKELKEAIDKNNTLMQDVCANIYTG